MTNRVSTGVDQFDEIVHGGLLAEHSYLVRGTPGSGKTTFGLHFLAEGVRQGETSLFINLGEEQVTVERVARNYGFPIDDIEFLNLAPSGEDFMEEEGYDIFSSAEVERQPVTDDIVEAVTDADPDRVFVDPVSQLRYLTPDEFHFRKQMLSLLRFLTDQGATVLFTSQNTIDEPDDDLQFLSDGNISLDNEGRRRTLEVTKLRGSDFVGGKHSMAITEHGIEVYPVLPLILDQDPGRGEVTQLSSGVPALDRLLGGGIERGTTTIISGPSGVGKSTLGTVFMKEAAGRSERSKLYLFEESIDTLVQRCRGINIPIDEMREGGFLDVDAIESLSMDTNQFAAHVKDDVEANGTDLVMIDGLEGYRLSVHQEDLLKPLHRLVRYLSNRGVTTLLIAETKDVTGVLKLSEYGGTYLADNAVFLRHVELNGELRRVIGVLKKRMSDYERNLREFNITPYGIQVGEPMTHLRGVLGGNPEFADDKSPQLLDEPSTTDG